MTKWTLAVILAAALAMTGCDSGSGSGGGAEDLLSGEPDTGGTAAVQCTKTATCAWGEACVDHACAIPEGAPLAPAKDFSVVDQCPGSETFEEEIALSDYHGTVIMLYFATTGCAACVADVKVYQNMIEQMEAKGFTGLVSLITVILPNGAATMADFTQGLTHPVVVDTMDLGIAATYGAGKDAVVLIDHAGYVVQSWPGLDVRGGAKDKSMLNETLGALAAAAL
ncbi:MAG: redoxin domain-containing protein [Pseudomonadota bacterium]